MKLLHIVNGDCTRYTLEETTLPGDIAVYADVLHEGPVPPGFDEASATVRASFLTDDVDQHDLALQTLIAWQTTLDRHGDYDEVVMWFEHDLFDQLLLVRHLAFFTQQQRHEGVRLICVDRYLGNLSAAELTALFPARTKVTAEQRALGSKVWTAFTSDSPMALQNIVTSNTTALPYLHGALIRFLEEYPAVDNGLGRIDNQVLDLLATRARSPDDLFRENAKQEERIFLGDLSFWHHVEQLARARTPLVQLQLTKTFDDRLPEGTVRITAAGRDVVATEADAIELNGTDRWLGGVHLQGDARWRWDAKGKKLLPLAG